MLWLGRFAEAQRICREASPEAARTMAELLKSDDDQVRLMTADKLLSAPGANARLRPQARCRAAQACV